MASMLKFNKTIRTLNLYKNRLGDEGAKAISSAVGLLFIDYCRISELKFS